MFKKPYHVFWLVVWLGLLAGYAWFVFYVLPSPARGQCVGGQCPVPRQSAVSGQQSAVNPAVVRIVVRDLKGGENWGSGTIVDRRQTAQGRIAGVVTAAHLLHDAGPRPVCYALSGGSRYSGTVEHVEETWDVAVLAIWDPGVEPIDLGRSAPKAGDGGRLAGWGPGPYREVVARLVQFVAPGGPAEANPFDWAEWSVDARQGDSGGPVLNGHGELVGVISGTNGRRTVGCSLPRLRRILGCCGIPRGGGAPAPIKPSPINPPTPQIDYEKLASLIYAKIQADAARYRGPAGPSGAEGPAGPAGDPGPPGPAGTTGTVDTARLAALESAIQRLDATVNKPIYVRKVNTRTGQESLEKVHLGEGLIFRMTPHK